MKNIVTLYDTSVATRNIGDFIIMDAVKDHLVPLVSQQIVTLPTHDSIGLEGLRILKDSDFSIVGGSNLLSSNLFNYNQWKFRLKDLFYLQHAVLMGVGWWQYQVKPDFYTRLLYKRVLHEDMIHSVRDQFTFEQLSSIGIKNIINTGCPTLWCLTKEHCSSIPKCKSGEVVFTLTDYKQDNINDQIMIDILVSKYEKVYFWPQGSGDLNYINSIYSNNLNKISIISPHLESFNSIVSSENIDYIGTRLHAGIRALQNKCRTIIIGIDNRATEKSKDFNLLVVDRKEIKNLYDVIPSKISMEISIPHENISMWKSQFKTK